MDPLCPFALSKKVGTGHHLFHVGVQMHHLAHNEEHRKQSPMQNEGGEDKWGGEVKNHPEDPENTKVIPLLYLQAASGHLQTCCHCSRPLTAFGFG